MKTSTKLFIAGTILLLISLGKLAPISLLCYIAGFILLIIEAIAKAESKNAAPRSDAGKQNYTYTYNAGKPNYTSEARKAYEDVTKKRKQEEKPPWEE